MTSRTENYDVIVIGGGAAGLSGAQALVRSRRSVLVIDDGTPRNAPADGVHNFCDGMTIAAAFTMSPRVGVVTSIAVILHELPQELADYALLRSAGMSRRGALLNLALVQLTAGLGAATTLLASQWSAGNEGIVLSLAAGMFLYIGAHDLLPEVVRAKQRGAWVAFAVGGALGLLG